ncbi:MAG: hypothetical protein P8182_09230 [Deltaproteobacteria bacterium]
MTKKRAGTVFKSMMLSLVLISASVLLPALVAAWNPVLRPLRPRINGIRQQALIRMQLHRLRQQNQSRQLKGQIRRLKRAENELDVRQEVKKLNQPRDTRP